MIARWPRTRLAVLVVALVAAGTFFTFGDVLTTEQVRDAVDGLGPAAPVVYVVVAAVLAAALVPGPLLAAASGLLFGVVLGTVVAVASSALTALLAQRLGRAAGLDGARAVLGPVRAAVTEDLLARRGLLAVVGQRLLPGVPDAPATYAFGALGATGWQTVLGTLIGASPRAFAYTALGASLDDPGSPLALAGLAVWVVVSVAGAELARRWWVVRRRSRAADGD
ncbi:TVP38/TMEM64 family protein [Nocardioides rubriscoriae]|uniref:TVP38/TMEM64 family protein n=1 Tax=Nocardioides rubriscoriae TaxID=642762 RepID=UPI001478E89E|nr:VTT domain-containing protein [Nocardioides rubriscoriae]